VTVAGSTGDLRAWRRDVDGWLGYVCYAESAGLRWLEWVVAERVRAATGGVSQTTTTA
jgi:hypothetical protein